jgi:hypothetical protein
VARRVIALAVGLLLTVGGCGGSSAPAPAPTPAATESRAGTNQAGAVQDTAAGLVPAGYGSLRQEDIALRLQVRGLQVRAIPLDEKVIRLLSPDSYRNLHELARSRAAQLEGVARRSGVRSLSLWLVSFYTAEQGETRFSPRELFIRNVGRDFRPLEVIGLSAGFGEQRLRPRETQSAILAFDGQVDVNQPLDVAYEGAFNGEWGAMLNRLERERSLVRTRAAAAAARKP